MLGRQPAARPPAKGRAKANCWENRSRADQSYGINRRPLQRTQQATSRHSPSLLARVSVSCAKCSRLPRSCARLLRAQKLPYANFPRGNDCRDAVCVWLKASISAGRTDFRFASISRPRDNDVRFFALRLSVVAKITGTKKEARRFVRLSLEMVPPGETRTPTPFRVPNFESF
jgi:hypothetical protein